MKKNVTVLFNDIGLRQKLLLRMKLTLLGLFICFMQVSASVYSQTTKFSFELKQKQVSEVLREIEENSDFRFFYQREQVDAERVITLNAESNTVDEILTAIFKDEGVKYKVLENDLILLSPESGNFSAILNAQQKSISGTVTDVAGLPLPGVTVVIKGTTNGSVTNLDGDYTISNIPENATLQFSFVGMLTQEVVIGNQTSINITMAVDAIGIEEVVAIGYGTKKKVNVTGAVASVDGDELMKRPVSNVGSMLQGALPGVQIVQNSGEPGNEGINIKVRGIGTFSNAGSNPLVLIDGVQGNLEDLNPFDIETVVVLKDAASASIYGSRAANGVILVTTKVGEAGKVSIEYSGNFGMHTPTKMFDVVNNSAEYMELLNEAKVNSGDFQEYYTQDMINTYRNATDREQYPNTDWVDLLFDPSPTHTHNLTFSGGSKETRFNITLGYVNQDGVMEGFSSEKYNLRINLASQVNDKIKFGGNFFIKKGSTQRPRQGSSDSFLAALSQPPTYSPMLADGSGRWAYKAYPFESNNKNIFAIIGTDTNRNIEDYAIYSQGWLDVELLKGLQWYTKAAINFDLNKYDDFRPTVPIYYFHTKEYATNLDVGGSGLINETNQNVYKNLYTYLAYNKVFDAVHNVNIQAGYSIEDNVYEYLRGYRANYPTDALRELDAGSPAVQSANGSQNEWSIMSFFGRLGYIYKDKYLLEANLRYDGSSRLSPDSRWGAFPSVSAGWRLTEESFVQGMNLTWMDALKLRASYGELGNQNIGLYPYQALLSLTSNYSYDNSSLSSGVAQTGLANENIMWESTSILDFGFDMTLFEGLSVTFDWYKKTTSDILRSSQLTHIVGLNPPTINNGTMENKGLELQIQYTNQIKSGTFNGLSYSAGFNIDQYKNKLVKFGAQEISGYSLREEGSEWNNYYMLEWIGIFQSESEIQNSPKQFNDLTVPGDLKWKDQDGDGDVDSDDRIPMAGKYPEFNYSFNFNTQWKGFDLYAMLQGVKGQKVYVDGWGKVPFVQGSPPTTEYVEKRWTESNPSQTHPRIYFGNATSRLNRQNSWFLEDASYLRLKNITVGYSLPDALVQRYGIEKFRVYLSGDNLVTLTDYPGLDPERAGSGRYLNYPQNKIYSVGLNVKF